MYVSLVVRNTKKRILATPRVSRPKCGLRVLQQRPEGQQTSPWSTRPGAKIRDTEGEAATFRHQIPIGHPISFWNGDILHCGPPTWSAWLQGLFTFQNPGPYKPATLCCLSSKADRRLPEDLEKGTRIQRANPCKAALPHSSINGGDVRPTLFASSS